MISLISIDLKVLKGTLQMVPHALGIAWFFFKEK